MATIGATALTYADWAKRTDDGGKVAVIIELLAQVNELLDDMLVIEGNLPTGHKTTVRTGLPPVTWRLLNYGVEQGKSTTAQITDTLGNLEAESQVDVDIADLNGNTADFRLSESKAYLQSMSLEMASTVFYGNTAVNPERFMGLSPRYNTGVVADAQTANNVIDAGGTGSNNTSIWIITWGNDTIHGIGPKGKPTGLRHEDKGKWRVFDDQNPPRPYWAYVDHYKWELGLSVRNWQFAVRIANIDVTELGTSGAANLINALVRGLYRLPVAPATATAVQRSNVPEIGVSMGRTVIYANRTIRTYLDLQAMDKTNVLLQMSEFDGKPVTMFRGIPIRTVDALVNNEDAVPFA